MLADKTEEYENVTILTQSKIWTLNKKSYKVTIEN